MIRAYSSFLFVAVFAVAIPVLAVRAFARGFGKARRLHGLHR